MLRNGMNQFASESCVTGTDTLGMGKYLSSKLLLYYHCVSGYSLSPPLKRHRDFSQSSVSSAKLHIAQICVLTFLGYLGIHPKLSFSEVVMTVSWCRWMTVTECDLRSRPTEIQILKRVEKPSNSYTRYTHALGFTFVLFFFWIIGSLEGNSKPWSEETSLEDVHW